MSKDSISITIELSTASKLLEVLAKDRKRFPTKSHIIEYAVKEFLSENQLKHGDAK
jgi:hypothetical protein